MHQYEPKLHEIDIVDLHPTQITVGMHQVAAKRAQWEGINDDKREKLLGDHMIPVVLGPNGVSYVIDHHHLARALLEEGVKAVLTLVVADFQTVPPKEFWRLLDHRNWVYPYDADGDRRDYAEIPKSIKGLVDDPYRSLAGFLRHAGGFAKEAAPFSEFQWADFMRSRISEKSLERDFDAALTEALALSHGHDANYLPGWCGVSKG